MFRNAIVLPSFSGFVFFEQRNRVIVIITVIIIIIIKLTRIMIIMKGILEALTLKQQMYVGCSFSG